MGNNNQIKANNILQFISKSTRKSQVALFAIAIHALVVVPMLMPVSTRAVTDCSPHSIRYSASSWLSGGAVNVCQHPGDNANNYVNNINGQSKLSGTKWECVELVNRLYLTKGWTTNFWTGNGNTMASNVPSGLVKQNNGSISYLNPGDVITLEDGGYGHAAIIESINLNTNTITIINQNSQNVTSTAYIETGSLESGNADLHMNGYSGYDVQAVIHHFGGDSSSPNNALQMLLTPDSAIYAKADAGYGGWTQETSNGTATKIVAGGTTQMMLAGDGSVWAKSSIGYGGWTQETSAGVGADISVSDTGLQMVRTTNSEVWAKTSIGWGGWTGEAGSGTAAVIAVGGNTQLIITGNGTVYARSGVGVGGWTQETNANVAARVAVSSTGVQMVQVTNGEVWAKNSIGYGGWTGEASYGTATYIAVGGNNQLLITGAGKLYAKNTIGSGGWTQETDASVSSSAVVSPNGLQVVRITDGQVWVKASIGYGGWTSEAAAGTANAVAVGG